MPEEFSEEYVKKLREEAASWRTKVRELEAQNLYVQVESELARRGVEADPGWVTLQEGQSVTEAVDALLEKYPNLKTAQQTVTEPEPSVGLKPTPKPVAPSIQQSTVPKQAMDTQINSRNIAEIRKDPKARAKVRDLYRSMLQRGNNNQGE